MSSNKVTITPRGTLVVQLVAGQDVDVIVHEGTVYVPLFDGQELIGASKPAAAVVAEVAAPVETAPARRGRGVAKKAEESAPATPSKQAGVDATEVKKVFNELNEGIIEDPNVAVKKLVALSIPEATAKATIDHFMADSELVPDVEADKLLASLTGAVAAAPPARGRGAAKPATALPPPAAAAAPATDDGIDFKTLKVGDAVSVELLEPLVSEAEAGEYPATVIKMSRAKFPTFKWEDESPDMEYNPAKGSGFGRIFPQ